MCGLFTPLLPFTTSATVASVAVGLVFVGVGDPTLANDTPSFICPTMRIALRGSCLYFEIRLKAAVTVRGYSSFPFRKLFSSSLMHRLYQVRSELSRNATARYLSFAVAVIDFSSAAVALSRLTPFSLATASSISLWFPMDPPVAVITSTMLVKLSKYAVAVSFFVAIDRTGKLTHG